VALAALPGGLAEAGAEPETLTEPWTLLLWGAVSEALLLLLPVEELLRQAVELPLAEGVAVALREEVGEAEAAAEAEAPVEPEGEAVSWADQLPEAVERPLLLGEALELKGAVLLPEAVGGTEPEPERLCTAEPEVLPLLPAEALADALALLSALALLPAEADLTELAVALVLAGALAVPLWGEELPELEPVEEALLLLLELALELPVAVGEPVATEEAVPCSGEGLLLPLPAALELAQLLSLLAAEAVAEPEALPVELPEAEGSAAEPVAHRELLADRLQEAEAEGQALGVPGLPELLAAELRLALALLEAEAELLSLLLLLPTEEALGEPEGPAELEL
jgi:hypothetical protein